MSFPIAPTGARYIKLGYGNAWFESCKANDRVELGHALIPHETALSGSREDVAAIYRGEGRTPGKATSFAREVLEFYGLGDDHIWITFAQGCLWWAFARPEVEMLGETKTNGQRARPLVAPWSNLDAHGQVLTINSLSTRLTQVASYRQTLCKVEAFDYLVRRINGEAEPAVASARQAIEDLVASAGAIIQKLHWHDFEVLCDLIFSRSGWQRVAELGGIQKDTDLVLQQQATGERAFVQVKSKADQSVLDDYVNRFIDDPGFDRMFFLVHSTKTPLRSDAEKPVHVWDLDEIARQAVAAGLGDWLVQKAG